VRKTLKGAPWGADKLTLERGVDSDIDEADLTAPFARSRTAAAVLLLAPPGKSARSAPAGAVQIGTSWFAVYQTAGTWRLGKDKQGLFAVWAGSARMLAEAARYVLAEPSAAFPVRSELTWGPELSLGKLSGSVNGCIAADLGSPIGLCAIVLADGGDRIYQATAKGKPPADVTAELELTTASKRAVAGDFDGDGCLDLASWDGKALSLARQTAGGTFQVQSRQVSLRECLSLDVMDTGAERGSGLLAGTPKGPVVLAPDGSGRFASRLLPLSPGEPAGRDLGPGGFCLVADIDLDGRCDIVQFFANGLLVHAGDGAGRFRAPAHTALRLVKNPCSAVCGDYDADGGLDIVVCGEDGLAFLLRTEDGSWKDATHVTGELAYHGNARQPRIVGAAPCDINNDGRQGVAVLYARRPPMLFFNRGFACFGLATELALSGAGSLTSDPLDPFAAPQEAGPAAATALRQGQAAGTVLDLNGDGSQDLLAVSTGGEVWMLPGESAGPEPIGLTIALSPAARGPRTGAVSAGRRRIAMHVVRPGQPTYVGLDGPCRLTLDWIGPDGKPARRTIDVARRIRVELP
jgi:hypothetical protein